MSDISSKLAQLGRMTPSRVRLDASASPLPLSRLLAFQEDHAAAKDAIFETPDWDGLRRELRPLAQVSSRARSRADYLKRPDLGRQLAPGTELPLTEPDLAIVIADGLSPPAVTAHAAAVVRHLRALLPELTEAPVCFAEQARVAIGDQIAERLGAQMVLVLIGERPGLTVSHSLGAYLTWAPRSGTRDSARNCVSNIHTSGGLTPPRAAERLAWLITEARRLSTTGIGLKDRSGELTIVS
ncbi:ethanolamine ammonia-lyase subunit EutC [Salipiger sp. PrR002]|uniref:ethanolamine ammonia-lyase subunit EutC n=1 Tax=Salipiger sp. PrR002 TaxID=2706489 RepID=UPI0013BA16B7|nr:ethanolamine ammonia-lyase subunit EutC [Salipiger sp. PrR002]NDW02512.1 ethanolamine ammonia-lyase subunit EutC [Salipiger sp. PrR002]NDW56144.1 ethanolamine ammonia-lyase subunit EutC [Salipiger sp. PrR004]